MQNFKSLCCIIDYLYDQIHEVKAQVEHMKKLKEEENLEQIKLIYDGIFIFAMIWAFGGGLTDARIQFSGTVKNNAKVKFPEQGQAFDYFWDVIQGEWLPWSGKVKPYNTDYDGLFSNLVVPTAETTR